MTAPAGRYELSLGGPVQLGPLTVDAVDISGGLTAGGISVSAVDATTGVPNALLGSTSNFVRTLTAAPNAINIGAFANLVQSGGGGSGTVTFGLAGRSSATGGSATHLVGVIGWQSPGASDIAPLSNQGYIGVEGRSDATISAASGVVSQGVLGLGTVGVANPTGTNTVIGVRGRVDFNGSTVSAQNNALIGGWFSINPAIPTSGGSAPVSAYAAVFGDPGNNWPVQFRGAISAAEADVNVSIDATTVQFLVDTGVTANVNGMRVRLRDAAGGSSFDIVDNTGGSIASFNSIHATTIGGILVTTASSAPTSGFRLPHGVAPTTPTNGDLWTTTAGMFVRINGVTRSVNLT